VVVWDGKAGGSCERSSWPNAIRHRKLSSFDRLEVAGGRWGWGPCDKCGGESGNKVLDFAKSTRIGSIGSGGDGRRSFAACAGVAFTGGMGRNMAVGEFAGGEAGWRWTTGKVAGCGWMPVRRNLGGWVFTGWVVGGAVDARNTNKKKCLTMKGSDGDGVVGEKGKLVMAMGI